MKRLLTALFLSGSMLSGVGLSGCTADNPVVPQEDLSIKTHFYPIVNGSKYTYVRFNNDSYDTVTYQVRVGQKRGDMNYLDRVDSSILAPQVLYYFALANDQFGRPAAVLKDTAQFYALAGNLDKDGNPWIAQESPRIYAQVVNQYDRYVPTNGPAFDNVIAVKYWQDGNTSDYTLRFYAKNFGLIREKKIVGLVTEIGSLQLIAKDDGYGNWIKQDTVPLDRYRGRYHIMEMAPDQYDPYWWR